MTSSLMRAAGIVVLIEGVWAFHVALTDYLTVTTPCPVSGCPGAAVGGPFGDIFLLLGTLLVLDGVVGAWGASFAYRGGAGLSVVFLAGMAYVAWADAAYSYLSYAGRDAEIGVATAVVAAVISFMATRARGGISEQANPMNLPVFG